ncbi:hypothetical protein K3495_g8095 [Podosphaera aphanis]|nr:hypothetical protein K3495_g8095 [Podosphaera aphanis]
MSTTVYPYLPAEKLREAEEESTVNELSWLLDSLEETLLALKDGLEECEVLLSPLNSGSTLVLSSRRSESIKGHVTRIGNKIVKGTLGLRLHTHEPLSLSISPRHLGVESSNITDTNTNGLSLHSLDTLRSLLSQALHCVDSVRFASPRVPPVTAAVFLSSQLRVLDSLFLESLCILKGTSFNSPTSATPASLPYPSPAWDVEPIDPTVFAPELPSTLALNFSINDCSLLLIIRVLEPLTYQPSLGARFLTGIGAQRRLEHDELDQEFMYRGKKVRVKEKCCVESSADPSLLSCAAKLEALKRTVLRAREALRILLGRDKD